MMEIKVDTEVVVKAVTEVMVEKVEAVEEPQGENNEKNIIDVSYHATINGTRFN